MVALEVGDAPTLSAEFVASLSRWWLASLPPREMAERYEESRSLPGDPDIGTGDVSRVAEQSRRVVDLIRRGRAQKARSVMGAVIERAKKAHVHLQRHEVAAISFMHACVEYVTTIIDPGTPAARSDALAEAIACRARVRDIAIPPTTPSDVIGVFAEADSILERREEQAPPVRITTTTDGCAVYIDGIWTGVSPLTVRRPLHDSMTVQVQCHGWHTPGRRHIVEPGAIDVDLHIDGSLERALSTGDVLRLQYHTYCASRARAVADATALATELGLREVVLVRRVHNGVQATAVRPGRPLARYWIELGDRSNDRFRAVVESMGAMVHLPSAAPTEGCL